MSGYVINLLETLILLGGMVISFLSIMKSMRASKNCLMDKDNSNFVYVCPFL